MKFVEFIKSIFKAIKHFSPSVVAIGGSDGPTKFYLNTDAKVLLIIIFIVVNVLIYTISKGGSIIEICKNNRHNS